MKRALVLVALSGCFDFDTRFALCHDGGAWICGAAGGGGAAAGGGAGGGSAMSGGGSALGGGSMGGGSPMGGGAAAGGGFVEPPDAGLWCSEGWCWEYPRPVGVSITAVAARNADDVWIGADDGLTGHWNGQAWVQYPMGSDFFSGGLCFRGGDLFLSGLNKTGGSSLFVLDGGGWLGLGATDEVQAMRCVDAGVLLSFKNDGAGLWDFDQQRLVPVYVSDAGEECQGVVERDDGGCSVACDPGSGLHGRSTIYSCGGQRELVPDGGQTLHRMWVDAARGPLVAGEEGIWQAAGNSWTRLLSTPINLVTGAPWSGGSFAVGAGWVTIPFTGMIQTEPVALPVRVFGLSVGADDTAFAVGDEGVIVRRDPDAGYTFVSRAIGPMNDVSVGRRALAVGTGGTVIERMPDGWKLLPLHNAPDYYGVWELPNGSFAAQGATHIDFEDGGAVSIPMTDVPVAVVDENTVLDTNMQGLYQVDLRDGGVSTLLTGMFKHACVDEQGNAFASAVDNVVQLTDAGATSLPGGPVPPIDLSCAGGRAWTLNQGSQVWFTKPDGGWSNVDIGFNVGHVVAVDANRAIAFATGLFTTSAFLVDARDAGATVQLADAPMVLQHARVFGGEVWVVGVPVAMGSGGSIVRLKP